MAADAEPDGAGDLLAGRYEVGELVGVGGTAQVYRAWDHERGTPVAVKVFRPGATPVPGDGGAREVRVLRGVSHPGLVGVQGCGTDGAGCPFVVMDFVDGQSLAGRLQDGPLRLADVVTLGARLADALAAVHARGIVHRDVKPANVLLDTGGRAWLTDFGIARIVDATPMTATGIVVGTGAYMAPEQVRGESVGPPADVYALGLVLLEAATGRREYDGNTLESALARLHRAPVVPRGVPAPLAAVLVAMTAADPRDRPQATEVAAALRRPVARVGSGRRAAPAMALCRRAAPAVALAGLVAAAIVGGAMVTGASPVPGGAAAVAAAAPAAIGIPPVPTGVPAPADPPRAGGPPQPVPVVLARREPAPAPARPAPGDRAGEAPRGTGAGGDGGRASVRREPAPGRGTGGRDARDRVPGGDGNDSGRKGEDPGQDKDPGQGRGEDPGQGESKDTGQGKGEQDKGKGDKDKGEKDKGDKDKGGKGKSGKGDD